MPLNEKKIQAIFKKYKNTFEELEHYDQTREKLWAKKKLNLTIHQRVINKLKEIRKETGKPISRIVEEAFS
ncbi:MAG: DUF6364 family protein [archaeon]